MTVQQPSRRFLGRIIGEIDKPNLLRLALLWLTLVSVAGGLVAVVEDLPVAVVLAVVTFGTLTGWLLGRARLAGWKSALAALGIGLTGLLLTIGRIGLPLWRFLFSVWPPLLQTPRCTIWPPLKPILPCQAPDFAPLFAAWQDLVESLSTLISRLGSWFQIIHSGARVIDPLVTLLLWGLAFWLVVAWAAWWIRRRGAIAVGLLPATALLGYNVYYTNFTRGILWLALTGGGWLLLQAAESYLKAQRRWQEHRLDRYEIEPLLAGVVIFLAGGLALAGGLLPSFSIEKLSHSIQEIFQGEQDKNLAESLGLQQKPQIAGKGSGAGISLSESHVVGAGPHLSQKPVLYVSVDGYRPPPPEGLDYPGAEEPEVRYYWRAQTYDHYSGLAWTTSPVRISELAADEPLYPDLTTLPENYRQVRQHVERPLEGGGPVFAAGELLSADQPSLVSWRSGDDLIGAETDAEAYTAISRTQYVSEEQLRAAGSDYPESLRRYLELPERLPARVRDLALDLTVQQHNAYDRAVAIETYLRQFPYSLDVPAPPFDRDVADYFLFDLKKGYCDYYATSMVVLARAAGLPARLVIGYVSGSYDYDNDRFVVVEADSHAWVEIYFPGLGWVEFEPTASEPTLPRRDETTGNASSASFPTPTGGTTSWAAALDWHNLRLPISILGIILAGLAGWLLVWRSSLFESWQLYLRPGDQAVKTIFHRLYRRGRAWGIPADAARTPHEFASALLTRLEQRPARKHSTPPVLAAVRADLGWLTALYTRLLFSPFLPSRSEHHQAVRAWGRLRQALFRLRRG